MQTGITRSIYWFRCKWSDISYPDRIYPIRFSSDISDLLEINCLNISQVSGCLPIHPPSNFHYLPHLYPYAPYPPPGDGTHSHSGGAGPPWYAQSANHEFNPFHWWEPVRRWPKWLVKHSASPNIYVSNKSCLRTSGEYSSDSHDISRSMDHDRSKVIARKVKGKTGSNNQCGGESSGVWCKFMNLRKVTKQFTKAQLWKQWNRLIIERPTNNMINDEKKIYQQVLKHLEKDL
jgi:hypothetical protein